MKRIVDKDRLYTAEEIEAEINKGWTSDEDHEDLCAFVDKAPMEKNEIEILRLSGLLDELYDAM